MNIIQKLYSEYYWPNFCGVFYSNPRHISRVAPDWGLWRTLYQLSYSATAWIYCWCFLFKCQKKGETYSHKTYLKILPDGEEAEGGRGHQRHPPRLEAAGSEGRLHPLLDLLGADDRHQLRLHLPAAVPPPRKASLTATSKIFLTYWVKWKKSQWRTKKSKEAAPSQ